MSDKKTFKDLIAVADYLVKNNYLNKEKIVISGGSAGGMLVGACINLRSDLFKVAIAHVPFVDVLNTMLDDTLPLTPGEFEEWGNPAEYEKYYEYIKSYSPYDNVKRKRYPHLFVTTGLSDPRVSYWEPAKWIAKLRYLKTDNNQILFLINFNAGHGGKTGRFKRVEEKVKEYSFILSKLSLG